MIKGAQYGGSGHDANIGPAGQLCHGLRSPICAALIGKGEAFRIEPAAEGEILIRQDHLRPGAPSGQRGGKPGGTRTDDQQITMQKAAVIGVGIILQADASEPSGIANNRLIDLFPKGGGPHEGFVIKPGC